MNDAKANLLYSQRGRYGDLIDKRHIAFIASDQIISLPNNDSILAPKGTALRMQNYPWGDCFYCEATDSEERADAKALLHALFNKDFFGIRFSSFNMDNG